MMDNDLLWANRILSMCPIELEKVAKDVIRKHREKILKRTSFKKGAI